MDSHALLRGLENDFWFGLFNILEIEDEHCILLILLLSGSSGFWSAILNRYLPAKSKLCDTEMKEDTNVFVFKTRSITIMRR